MDYRRMTREFLLGETRVPSLNSHLESISEALAAVAPRTKTESLRVESAKTNLKEVQWKTRKLQERVDALEDELKKLEASKDAK